MRAPLLCTLLALGIFATAAQAMMLSFAGDRLDFTRPAELATKATWGAEGDRPLDFTADGIGDESLHDRSYRSAWIQTHPIPLGGNGHPYPSASLTVEIGGHLDKHRRSCVSRIFARHSPDLKHWTSWQPLRLRSEEEREALNKRAAQMIPPTQSGKAFIPTVTIDQPVTFVGSLDIPRSVQNRYRAHAARYKAAGLAHPRGHEDLVRWILAEDPDYFATEIPFVGYLQVLVEFDARSGSNRLRSLTIGAFSIVDEMTWLPADEQPDAPKRWNFVAP